MRMGRALVPLPTTALSTEPDHRLAAGDAGMGGQPTSSPPTVRRLKLVIKQAAPQEVRAVAPGPATTRTSRTGRVVKPPTSFAPAPATTAGKRKPGFRKKEANIVCVHCGRGNSPSSNQIVFCDGCNATWHQKCSDPPIPDDVIEVRDMEWFCNSCKPAQRSSTKAQSSKTAGKKRTDTQKPAPKVQSQPQLAPGLDAGGNQFTTHEQRGYLAALSHAQLVELVVNIAAQNPTVAIFPANLRDLPTSQFADLQASSVNTTTGSSSAPGPVSTVNSKKRGRAQSAAAADDESGAAAARPAKRLRTISAPAKPTTTNTTTTKVKAADPSRKTSASTRRSAPAKSPGAASSSTSRLQSVSAEPDLSRVSSPEESELETDEDDFDEIEDHRLYPRPGNGFTPPSDPADLNILAEDPESQTFSHRLHGPAKQTKQAKVTKRKAS